MELPVEFVQSMRARLGQDYEAWEASMAASPPVSVRINPAKISHAPALEPIPWTSHGFYLPLRPSFAQDPAWHAGAYYVQEASSMLIEAAIPTNLRDRPIRALDLCGAPGGKTTHLSSLIHPHSLIVANEVIRQRSKVLLENISKWGSGNVLVTNQDPRALGQLQGFFDLILVDAPCSGEGMFRKDPDAIAEWSPEHVQLCAARQQRILEDIWPALRPGGVLIYSTCTWNKQEDEEQIDAFLRTHNAALLPISVSPDWGLSETPLAQASVFHCLPHQVKGEGFFLAAIQKTEEDYPREESTRWKKLTLADKKDRQALSDWMPEDWSLLSHAEFLYALPEVSLSATDEFLRRIPVLQAGVELGEKKGKDYRPAPAAAWWTSLNQDAFETMSLDHEEALRFLRRDPQSFSAPKSWLLMQYEAVSMGWAKGLGNRINNYYPQPWRMRMELPTSEDSFSLLSSF